MKKIRVNIGGRDFLYWDGFYWLTGDAEFDGRPFENSSIDAEYVQAEKAFGRTIRAMQGMSPADLAGLSAQEIAYIHSILSVADSYKIEVLVCS